MRAFLAAVLLAQAATPRFPAEVELVTVDAVVLDDRGRPVAGLGRDEFVVREDGEAQEIATFEPYAGEEASVGEQPTGARRPTRRCRAPGPSSRSSWTISGWRAVTSPTRGTRSAGFSTSRPGTATRSSSLHQRHRVVDGDPAGGTRGPPRRRRPAERPRGRRRASFRPHDGLRGLRDPRPRRRDHCHAGRRPLDGHGGVHRRAGAPDPSCPTRVRAAAASVDSMRKQRTQRLLATLRRTLDALAASRGRKSILLYSRGFMEDSDLRIREVTSMARAANAAVYFVDTHGLLDPARLGRRRRPRQPQPVGLRPRNFEAGVLESTGAQALADETGGLSFRNTNDLAAAGMRVARESRAYYLLGLRPRPGRKPGEWRKLEVAVTRPGLTVRTRKGYRVQPAGAAARTSAVVASALDSVVDAGGIPVRATASSSRRGRRSSPACSSPPIRRPATAVRRRFRLAGGAAGR